MYLVQLFANGLNLVVTIVATTLSKIMVSLHTHNILLLNGGFPYRLLEKVALM